MLGQFFGEQLNDIARRHREQQMQAAAQAAAAGAPVQGPPGLLGTFGVPAAPPQLQEMTAAPPAPPAPAAIPGETPTGPRGLLTAFNVSGGPRGETVEQPAPYMDAERMREMYALLAERSDNPTGVLYSYMSAMQGLDNRQMSAQGPGSYQRLPAFVGAGNRRLQPFYNQATGELQLYDLGAMHDAFKSGSIRYTTNEQGEVVPTVGVPEVAQNQASIAAAETTATDRARRITRARETLEQMNVADNNLRFYLEYPGMEDVTGPISGHLSRLSQLGGGERGQLYRQFSILRQRLENDLRSSFKGDLSNKEIESLRRGLPSMQDNIEVWRRWYNTQYLPYVNRLRDIAASGEDAALMRATGPMAPQGGAGAQGPVGPGEQVDQSVLDAADEVLRRLGSGS